MSSLQFMLPLLQCPYCKRAFDFTLVQQPQLADREFGILSCSCYKYPVIDGIPIILKRAIDVQAHVEGSVQVHGPNPAELISLILQQQGTEALLSLISFPWGSQPFMKVRLLRKLTQRNPIRNMRLGQA